MRAGTHVGNPAEEPVPAVPESCVTDHFCGVGAPERMIPNTTSARFRSGWGGRSQSKPCRAVALLAGFRRGRCRFGRPRRDTERWRCFFKRRHGSLRALQSYGLLFRMVFSGIS